MERKLHQQITFFLTGRADRSNLVPMDGRYRPALFARYRDLSTLRFDFPLVLNAAGPSERAVLSLSRLVDDAIEKLHDDPERDRIARHGYRLEREIRRDLAGGGTKDFEISWNEASQRLAEDGDGTFDDSARRLWKAFDAKGDLADADSDLPAHVVRHAWESVRSGKSRAFRKRAERLLHKLYEILEAETVESKDGRSPQRLRSGIGSSFAGSFDFDAMSRILLDAKPGVQLSDERRKRLLGLIDVLENQRFFDLGNTGADHFKFEFMRCSDALTAYQDRHDEAIELIKTLEVAELEVSGDYRDSVHNELFAGFGANGLDAEQLAELPDYLVCTDGKALDSFETAQMVELLAAGLHIKILVQTDDVLETSVLAEGHVALGLRARQLVNTSIGLTDVFVFQASASTLFQMHEALLRGLNYNGPALFSVYSGANPHTGDVPAYLVAAAAMESRVFPALVYDPSAGMDWASRLQVTDNPEPDDDWPVHVFTYEDKDLQARSEKIAFTLADFMAMDRRFFRHFSIVPKADWSDAMIPVPEALDSDRKGLPENVPSITLVDDEGGLQRAIFDSRTLLEARRCRTMWHSLQELGGIHNSHAERQLALERKTRSEASLSELEEVPSAEASVTEPLTANEVLEIDPAAAVGNRDDPFIETARCTTCNECTEINSGMFAYNDNKQAYIADPDAGTFRQLVEAAEGCQVSIIHPGKPRNPKEPGLEDLIRRAAEFN